jgi:HSP20 family protein
MSSSLFSPQFFRDLSSPSFLRLLDEFHNSSAVESSSNIRAFQPRFDVRETKEAYELHGELPGISQKDVEIEFTNPHTLVIKGHTEHTYESGTRPGGAITEGEAHHDAEGKGSSNKTYHKPTVEDEDEAAGSSSKQVAASTKHTDGEHNNKLQKQKQHHGKYRYWVSERSTGEFHRTFEFPSRVDQDNVKASLKDGILEIVVPKVSLVPHAKKIVIE